MLLRNRLLLAALGISAVAALLVWMALNRAPAPAQVKLADGRRIELAGMTFGQSHSLPKTWRSRVARLMPGSARRLFGPDFGATFGFGSPGLALWLMCYDPVAGGYQSGWINTCTAVDEHGCEFPARNIGSTGDGYYLSQVVFFPGYPRRQTSFICRIYDMNGKPFADLPIAIPSAQPGPAWKPENLPLWKTNGPLTLRLDGFSSATAPRFEISRKGVPETFWVTERTHFEDASGNIGESLCRREAAWNFKGTFHRGPAAPFAEDEVTSLNAFPIAPPGAILSRPFQLNVGGKMITNITVAGPGRYDWSNNVVIARSPWLPNMREGHGSSSAGFGAVNTTTTWRVSDQPFLVLRKLEIPPQTKLIIRVSHQTNILGGAVYAGSAADLHFFDLPDRTPFAPVDLAFILDQGVEFEAKVSPAAVFSKD